ncbi:flavin-containing monooxygenase [Roseomonas sp. BN140053]|uniref:flavin-containing monooxygenase n=1 Tax=Roseomonas sp. BN140053 TaxID=3391898 RepID=UPI0039E9A931
MNAMMSRTEEVDFVIIGAGLGGLTTAAKLLEAGAGRVVLLERSDRLGGVWGANHYPNVACDTPIDLYALSFYPGRKWTTNFAPGQEILAYLREFAELHGVADRIRYGTEVRAARWDESRQRWSVAAADGREWRSRFLVWAGGILSQPVVPEVPGQELFRGESLHTTAWSEHVSLEGKRVAVIGGGATSIQVVPYAAEHARETVVFVRTPSYVMPRPDLFFDHETTDPEKFAEQQRERREHWFQQFELIAKGRFPMNHAIIAQQQAEWRKHFDQVIHDPKLRELLTPKYPFGCKRPLFSNLYYPALNRPSVTVVGSGVVRLTEGGVVDRDGREYPVDAIIWATGFDPVGMLGALDIHGRDGQPLKHLWSDGPEAFYGTFVKGFPNLFVINGPNVSGASATDFIESQLRVILDVLAEMRAEEAGTVEVSPDAHDAFNAAIQARATNSVLVHCESWYRAGGTGKIFTHWPGTIEAFRAESAAHTREGLVFSPQRVEA